ncbi:MAG: GNAT family acetyltransferase [Pseudomonadota bacterium]
MAGVAVRIVPYKDAYFDGVDRLWSDCFPDDPPRNSARPSIAAKQAIGPVLGNDLILIALGASGDVIGTVMAGYDGHRGWLYSVAVAPDHRRSGVGRSLVEEACAKLGDMGCAKVNLQIRAGNEAVVAFYRTLGFDEEPRVSMGRVL